jgi:rRNA pseudouridine-1189 N-methylase Emg1 (Nep1/Mra1 family)
VLEINVREYRRANQKWKIQRNWQYRVHKKKNKNATQYVLDNNYTHSNINDVIKT